MADRAETSVQAWARLLRAQKVLLEGVEADLKEAGLPPLAWYDVLLELKRNDGLRQHEIGERILLSKHNLTRLLDRLESRGLVARRACREDARSKLVSITDEGRALQKRMWPVYARAIKTRFTSRLTTKDIESLSRILSKLLG